MDLQSGLLRWSKSFPYGFTNLLMYIGLECPVVPSEKTLRRSMDPQALWLAVGSHGTGGPSDHVRREAMPLRSSYQGLGLQVSTAEIRGASQSKIESKQLIIHYSNMQHSSYQQWYLRVTSRFSDPPIPLCRDTRRHTPGSTGKGSAAAALPKGLLTPRVSSAKRVKPRRSGKTKNGSKAFKTKGSMKNSTIEKGHYTETC